MSGHALYRVLVRMLYDPALAAEVYADRTTALAGEDLSARERDWLVAPDPRAYRTDPRRRSRTLAPLMEELSTACALVLRRGREGSVRPETELLDAFFASSFFHGCVRDGGALVFAFADYLEFGLPSGGAADTRGAALVRLESAIARVRRVPPPAAERGGLAAGATRLILAPWSRVLGLPLGTSELQHRISRALTARGRNALQSLLDPRWSLPVLIDLSLDAEEHLLVEKAPRTGMSWAETPVRYALITPELYHLLQAAATAGPRAELEAMAGKLGAEPGEETAIVGDLAAESLLVPVGESPEPTALRPHIGATPSGRA